MLAFDLQTIYSQGMSSDTVCTENTPITPPRAIKRRNRRITDSDVEAMAELMVECLNEREACQQLGIKEVSWYSWKSKRRSEARLAHVLARLRGNQVLSSMKAIKKAGERDWRAHDRRLQLLDRERFSDKASNQPQQINVQVFAQIDAVLSKVYAEPKPQAVIDTTATKLLPEPGKP